MAALNVDLSSKTSKNISILKRFDPDISEILETSTHVAIYNFEAREGKWNRKGVEGAAFVVRTSTNLKYYFVVLNKQGYC